MKEKFIDKRFSSSSLLIIEKAEEIIDYYESRGFSLSLRQLYYQFVARDIIPNTEKSYKRIGSIVNDARLSGLIDWRMIDDRTRKLKRLSCWDSPQDIMKTAAMQYRTDKWTGSNTYIEIWVEKDALSEIVGKASDVYEIPYFPCRGYVSQSAMYDAAKRFENRLEYETNLYLLYLGDHDPSGIDMTRDISNRFEIFGVPEIYIKRIALNMDQIHEQNPPPNPAKITDSRYRNYVSEYGNKSWELDSLNPDYLYDLIISEIENIVDVEEFENKKEEQEIAKKKMFKMIDNFDYFEED